MENWTEKKPWSCLRKCLLMFSTWTDICQKKLVWKTLWRMIFMGRTKHIFHQQKMVSECFETTVLCRTSDFVLEIKTKEWFILSITNRLISACLSSFTMKTRSYRTKIMPLCSIDKLSLSENIVITLKYCRGHYTKFKQIDIYFRFQNSKSGQFSC